MFRTWAAAFLLLLTGATVRAQQDTELRVTVLEGEGAINNIRDRTARAPVVRVTDAAERPVAGAIVNFTLPDYGPGGSFLDGRQAMTVSTDQDGRAVARGLRPNNVAGRFQIRVTASSQGRRASAAITQINLAPAAARGSSKKKWLIAALVAGGAAGAAVALTGGGNNSGGGSSTPSGTTVTPGSPVFGPPR